MRWRSDRDPDIASNKVNRGNIEREIVGVLSSGGGGQEGQTGGQALGPGGDGDGAPEEQGGRGEERGDSQTN